MLDKSSKGTHIACQKLTEHRDTLLRDLCMCWCAAAQQGLQEGDVSGPVTVGSALAGIQAGLWRAVPVESAVRSGHHGEVSQVAHLLNLTGTGITCFPGSVGRSPGSQMKGGSHLKRLAKYVE